MDNSIAAENSATGSPEICHCGGKPIKRSILRNRIVRTYPTQAAKPHVSLYGPDSLSDICLFSSLIVDLDRRSIWHTAAHNSRE